MEFFIINTHLGSGASILLDSLQANDKIAVIHSSPNFVYKNPLDLIYLANKVKKQKPFTKIIIDKICFNYQMGNNLYDVCKFIYFIRPPEETLNYIIENKKYTLENALNYYCFRLKRMLEMLKNKQNKIIIKWNELSTAEIKSFLGIKNFNLLDRKEKVNLFLNNKIIEEAKSCFNAFSIAKDINI